MELWHPHIYSPRPVHLTPHSIRKWTYQLFNFKNACPVLSQVILSLKLSWPMLCCIANIIQLHELIVTLTNASVVPQENNLQTAVTIYLNIGKSLELYDFKKIFACECYKKKQGDFFGFFYVLYSTLLHLPLLRFHCVGGCWDRTPDCCDFFIGSQTLYPLTLYIERWFSCSAGTS